MAKTKPIEVPIRFSMVDAEGTETLRDVSAHCIRIGEAWTHLGEQMYALAEKLDVLAPPPFNPDPDLIDDMGAK